MATDSTSPQRAVSLVRLLAEEGDRIFTPSRASELAARAGLSEGYVRQALHHLARAGWIVRLRRGLYALSTTFFRSPPVHPFEVAMAVVRPAAVSHGSALHAHGLSETTFQDVCVLTTTEASLPRERGVASGAGEVQEQAFTFVQVLPERFFGTQEMQFGDSAVVVTDPERTLIDGLERPQYCGGFSGVLRAFELHRSRLDLPKIIDYARRLDGVTAHRLGWVLEHVGFARSQLEVLAVVQVRGRRVLDVSGPRRGPCRSHWMIQENLLPGFVKRRRSRLQSALHPTSH